MFSRWASAWPPQTKPQYRSELKLEGELDGAGAADLVKRTEAPVWAAGAEAAGQRGRRMAEQGAGQVVVGRPEIWMIEDVEKFRAETKTKLLRKVKLALERNVGLRGAESAQDVAPEITLGRWGRRAE